MTQTDKPTKGISFVVRLAFGLGALFNRQTKRIKFSDFVKFTFRKSE